jgi:gliding motility-associated-like protein
VYEVCLQATNAFGCTDTLCQDVPMISELLVYVPNAFTPDNDGLNDLFTPSVLGILPNTYVFKVFDRWGHVVFETREIGQGWNGSFQNGGYYVQEDVYIWQIEGQDVRNAEIQVFQGHVTVVR